MRAATFFGGRQVAGLAAAMWVCAALVGCGGNPSAKDLPLDKALAKQSLTTTLDAWKAGEKPAALKDRQPSIIASDSTWEAGAKLTDYQLKGERDLGANLSIDVVLTTEKDGRTSKQEVTYIVGTSPVITVSLNYD